MCDDSMCSATNLHTISHTTVFVPPPPSFSSDTPGRAVKGMLAVKHKADTAPPHVSTACERQHPRQRKLLTMTPGNTWPQGEINGTVVSLHRGGGVQDHSLPPILFQPLQGKPGSVTRRDPRPLPTPRASKQEAWTTNPPTADNACPRKVICPSVCPRRIACAPLTLVSCT